MLHVTDDGRLTTDSETSFRVNSDRAEWLRARKASIGASEIATLCGLDPRSSLLDLYAKKTVDDPDALDVVDDEDLDPNDRMFWGTVLQPAIAQGFAKLNRWRVIDAGETTQFFATAHPRMTATLDYVIAEAEGRDGPGVFEIKNVDAAIAAELGDAPDPRHVFQVQAGCAATGLSWGVIGALRGGNRPKLWFVNADPALHATLRGLVDDFFALHVDVLSPPSADDSKATERALKAMFPEVEETRRVILPASAADLFAERRELAKKIAECDRMKRGIENRVKLAIGDAAAVLIPGVGVMKHSIVKKDAFVMKACEYPLVSWPRKTWGEKKNAKTAAKEQARALADFADAEVVEIEAPDEIEVGRELNDAEDEF